MGILPNIGDLLCFFVGEGLNANDIHKEMFLFTVGSVVA
jgi:hypothetical protein